ncbi:endonuclease [Mycoplasmopsis alligatoris]|uniref:Nuclease, EndA/NucM family n=1 Tax=Mycoplasmopsis alligatoris A21JP2 TaxID=747682 RepID=D4XW94_9BACT|nr:endonuclease [Mycoplasmopsis alligatoris]EFF41380.1 nuclease, EndA/NucM family [Mycoplasmopsis alligatoris A21JP2]
MKISKFLKNTFYLFCLPIVTLATISCSKNLNSESNSKYDDYASKISFKNNQELTDNKNIDQNFVNNLEIINNNNLNYNVLVDSFIHENDNLKIKFYINDLVTNNKSNLYTFLLKLNIKSTNSASTSSNNLVYDNSNNYYSELEGLKGQKLFNKLLELQAKYTKNIKQYNDLYTIYKDAFIDKYYEKDNSLLDIYSENPSNKDPYNYNFSNNGSSANKEGLGFNREHLIPQSWFKKISPTRNDAHFVWPTDIKVNSLRSNYPHYLVASPVTTTLNGTKISFNLAEPIDVFKGDIARAYFYFQVTHKNADTPAAREVFDEKFPFFKQNYLDEYLKWSKSDKIDQFDIDRNNAIAKHYQGLRNPFSDYPELAILIWDKDNNSTFKNKGVLIKIQ